MHPTTGYKSRECNVLFITAHPACYLCHTTVRTRRYKYSSNLSQDTAHIFVAMDTGDWHIFAALDMFILGLFGYFFSAAIFLEWTLHCYEFAVFQVALQKQPSNLTMEVTVTSFDYKMRLATNLIFTDKNILFH